FSTCSSARSRAPVRRASSSVLPLRRKAVSAKLCSRSVAVGVLMRFGSREKGGPGEARRASDPSASIVCPFASRGGRCRRLYRVGLADATANGGARRGSLASGTGGPLRQSPSGPHKTEWFFSRGRVVFGGRRQIGRRSVVDQHVGAQVR